MAAEVLLDSGELEQRPVEVVQLEAGLHAVVVVEAQMEALEVVPGEELLDVHQQGMDVVESYLAVVAGIHHNTHVEDAVVYILQAVVVHGNTLLAGGDHKPVVVGKRAGCSAAEEAQGKHGAVEPSHLAEALGHVAKVFDLVPAVVFHSWPSLKAMVLQIEREVGMCQRQQQLKARMTSVVVDLRPYLHTEVLQRHH